MNEFFTNIWNSITQVLWSDWIIVIILLGFSALGFFRGMAKDLINLGFVVLAIIIAWLFYEQLADSVIINWLSLPHQSHLAIVFGTIFIGVIVIKRLLYKLINLTSTISNPCALNQLFTILTLLIITTFISYHYLDAFVGFSITKTIFSNEMFRDELSFIVVFTVVIAIFLSLKKVFNISVGTAEPCLLSALFQKS